MKEAFWFRHAHFNLFLYCKHSVSHHNKAALLTYLLGLPSSGGNGWQIFLKPLPLDNGAQPWNQGVGGGGG